MASFQFNFFPQAKFICKNDPWNWLNNPITNKDNPPSKIDQFSFASALFYNNRF